MNERLPAHLFCLFWFLLTTGTWARARVALASLLGEVRDEQAAVPGAKVTARHEATDFSRGARTGDDGGYRIDDLLPGRSLVFGAALELFDLQR